MSRLQKGILSLAALSVSAASFAATDMESRVRELEKEMKEVRSQTAAKTYGAYATTARPENDGKGFFASFDVLYWQSLVDGVEFCYGGGCEYTTSSPIVSTLPTDSTVRAINFNKWDWGFRAGAGYKFEHGEWDVFANFTYFKNSSDLTIGNGVLTTILNNNIAASPLVFNNGQIVNTTGLTVNNLSQNFDKATSTIKISFDRLDLELGRDFFVSKFLSMRPHVGLMTAWFNIRQRTEFTGGTVGYNAVDLSYFNKFWGIGPRTGLDTKWHLCNGFSIVGNTSASLVYGYFKNQKLQTYSYNTPTNTYNMIEDYHRFTPTAQLQLGLGYDRYTNDCKQHFSAFFAWDVQYWFGMNRFLPADSIQKINHDLSLQGATLHLRLDF